jgi:hypothetical protein
LPFGRRRLLLALQGLALAAGTAYAARTSVRHRSTLAQLYANRAAARLMLGRPTAALADCREALEAS